MCWLRCVACACPVDKRAIQSRPRDRRSPNRKARTTGGDAWIREYKLSGAWSEPRSPSA